MAEHDTFVFSCLSCLRTIHDGKGNALSCTHFVCDECLRDPKVCPVCDEVCEVSPLVGGVPELANYLRDAAKVRVVRGGTSCGHTHRFYEKPTAPTHYETQTDRPSDRPTK